MYASNENEHQDVLTIIASSKDSIAEAVKRGVAGLRRSPQHQNLVFRTFQVVSIQGTICDDGQSCGVDHFQVVIQAAGVHRPAP